MRSLIKKRIAFTLLFASFLLPSISSHAFGRQYSEIKLSPDTFVVNIRATSTTTAEQAYSGLLTRASELTLNNGYKYFVVTENADKSDYVNHTAANIFSSSTHAKRIPHTQMTIKCYAEKPSVENVIEANFFLENKKSK